MKTVLITGGTGFIGHFLVKEFIKDHNVICCVRPGTQNLERLAEILDKITVIEHNIRDNYDDIFDQLKHVNIILHLGGNPSSEDSINNPTSVVHDNVIGTLNVLELARRLDIERVFYYSAGEIFGPVEKGCSSKENDAYNSVSPYAASKAAGEELCIAYAHTFKVPVSITHITNTFGERSQSNRFPVIAIRKILNNEKIIIHSDKEGNIGGRRWFHAEDVALQTRFILNNQSSLYEKWNSSGKKFISNLDFAQLIATQMDKKLVYEIQEISRAGHDSFFSLDSSKIYNRGWEEPINIEGRISQTVDWYLKNQNWLVRG